MSLKAKKYLITTKTREIFIVRRDARCGFPALCALCEAPTEMLSLDEAVSVSALSARQIIRRLEAETLHSMETVDGHLFICRNSLLAEF